MPELHLAHKGGVEFPDFGGLVPPARVAPDKWLSGLPEDWQVVLVKHIFAFNEKGRGSDSEAILSLTQRGILERDISGNEGQLAESYENYPQVLEGDFVLNPMDLVAGWVARTNISGKVSGAYYSFHITNQGRADGRFFEYLFQTYYRERIFDPFGSGLGRMESGGGRWTLGRDVLMNFPVPLPPINAQRVLAAYLDQETSQIDLLISKKEQLIEKLLERRQVLITQAVTKGLDPNVPMKDSGLEWVGQVPATWDVRPHWAFVREKKVPVANLYKELTLLSLTKQGVIVRDMEGGGKFPTNFEGYQRVEPGDLVLCLFDVEETPRTVGLVANSGMITSAYTVMTLRDIEPKFFEWYLIGMDNEKRFKPFYSGLRNTLPKPAFGSIRFAVPQRPEQLEILEYLNQETVQIDALVAKARKGVELLRERRQALITQVVTGKLDVRGFVSGNS